MRKSTRLILTTAIASITLPTLAFAQYRVGSDGQALDANNRVGSNGYNNGGPPAPYVTQQNVFTGNVTGGRQFRNQTYITDPATGRSVVVNTPIEQDPGAFRGNLGSASFDPFLRNSAAAPVRGTPSVNQTPDYGGANARPFYGNNIINPPEGYVRNPYSYTGTYVPSPSALPLNRGAVDLNYNIPPTLNEIYNNAPNANIPHAGTQSQALIGATGANGVPQLYASAPTGAITPWQPNEGPDQFYTARTTSYLPNRPDFGRPVDAATLAQYRRELAQTYVPDNIAPNQLATPNQSPGTSAQALTNNTNPLNRPNPTLTQPGQSLPAGAAPASEIPRQAPNQPLNAQPLGAQPLGARPLGAQPLNANSVAAATPVPNNFITNQGTQTNYPAPAQQSTQLAELQRRNAALNRSETQAPAPHAPAANNPHAPRALAPENAPAAPQPLKITSLATGIRAKGLSSLLSSAEDLMKQGKFTSAIARYQAAEQVAPNNPLPVLGRAFAELGGGYYQRAEIDLRRAVLTEPALLQGDYDLPHLLSDDRLQTAIRDLKALSSDEKRSPGPLILLAFIAHNTNAPDRAADYLVAAQQRTPNEDPLITALRHGWSLPNAR